MSDLPTYTGQDLRSVREHTEVEQKRDSNRLAIGHLLQTDLTNEVRHMMFYLRAASEVQGLHREELREFFMKEAAEEMGHVHEFADMVSYFGFNPVLSVAVDWGFGHSPVTILEEVVRMEEEVAANYAQRLQQTEAPNDGKITLYAAEKYDPWVAAAHVFYEDQIKNSQTTAWEVRKWLTRFPLTATIS